MISSEYALLARLAEDGGTIRKQLAQVQEQVSTGRVAGSYAGLGAGARTSLDLRPALAHQAVWQSNIDTAEARLDVTQSSLKAISGIASEFYGRTNNLNQLGVSEVASIAGAARSALQQVAQLLNSKLGDVYVFAGQDTGNPPLPSTDPAVLGSALLASDTATAPFSATLGTAPPQVEVAEGQRLSTGVLANQNTLAVSEAPTTGSYMRDVMRALATLAGLTEGPGVPAVSTDTRARLSSAITAMATETGALGNVQNTFNHRRAALDETSTALTKQISSVEDVDVAAALTRASTLQTQLQASYQVIAGSRELSLARFL